MQRAIDINRTRFISESVCNAQLTSDSPTMEVPAATGTNTTVLRSPSWNLSLHCQPTQGLVVDGATLLRTAGSTDEPENQCEVP